MLYKTDIDAFFSNEKIALIGLSRDKNKFGNMIYDELTKRGYQIFPIHSEQTVGEIKCYPNFDALPDDVKALIICTKADKVSGIIKGAIKRGISSIWVQQGGSSPEVKEYSKFENVTLIDNQCIFMYLPKNGFPHNFHHFIWKIIGKAAK